MSTLGGGTIIVGTIVAVIFGAVLDRTKAYKFSLTIGSIIAFLSIVGLMRALNMNLAV